MLRERVRRERHFHDRLADADHGPRRLAHRAATGLYDSGVLWGPVLQSLDADLRGALCLDLGCGSAWLALELAGYGARVMGVDISWGLLARARENVLASGLAPRVSLIQSDAHCLPFRDETFDFVFGSGILHHLDFDRACAEVARILKRGGRAFFVEPLDGHPLVRLFRRLTPGARSPDERPLNLQTVTRAGPFFSSVRHQEIYLLSVTVGILNLLSPRLGGWVLPVIRNLDGYLLGRISFLRRWAWITLVELMK